jgi:hypothetical protein
LVLAERTRAKKLVIEIQFKGYPKCDAYSFDAEVYLKGDLTPLHKELKTIRLKELICIPCLPAGPRNTCGNNCQSVSLRPYLAPLNFDFLPYLKDQKELRVLFKNLLGVRKNQPQKLQPENTDDAKGAIQDLTDCKAELPDAELTLKGPDFLFSR